MAAANGRLAQLEEHLLDVQGVRGSSPLPPTSGQVAADTPYKAPAKRGPYLCTEF